MTSLSDFSSSLTGLPMTTNLESLATQTSYVIDSQPQLPSYPGMFYSPGPDPSPIPSLESQIPVQTLRNSRHVNNSRSHPVNSQPLDQYDNCQEIISKGRNNIIMTYNEKKTLMSEIDKLETKDHIGILKIIINHSPRNKKLYTVNNQATFIDLNDLTQKCLWDICYYVKLCLQNQQREKEKQKVQKFFLDEQRKVDEQTSRQSKLRLTCSSTFPNLKSDTSRSVPKTKSDQSVSNPNRTHAKTNEYTPTPIDNTNTNIQDNPENEEGSAVLMNDEDFMDDDEMVGGDDQQGEGTRVLRNGSDLGLQLGAEETDDLDLPLLDDDSQNGYLSD